MISLLSQILKFFIQIIQVRSVNLILNKDQSYQRSNLSAHNIVLKNSERISTCFIDYTGQQIATFGISKKILRRAGRYFKFYYCNLLDTQIITQERSRSRIQLGRFFGSIEIPPVVVTAIHRCFPFLVAAMGGAPACNLQSGDLLPFYGFHNSFSQIRLDYPVARLKLLLKFLMACNKFSYYLRVGGISQDRQAF